MNRFKIGDRVIGASDKVIPFVRHAPDGSLSGGTTLIFNDITYIRIIAAIQQELIRLDGDEYIWFHYRDFVLKGEGRSELPDLIKIMRNEINQQKI